MGTPFWTRRRFLAAGTVVAVAAALPVTAILESLLGRRRHAPDQLTFAVLAPLKGQRVRLLGDTGSVLSARVIAITDLSNETRGIRVRQSSILMRTALHEPVPDCNFRIQHPEWGECELYCTPVVSRSRTLHYEAVLSHLETPVPYLA